MATAATHDGNGLWVPLSELARLRGVTKGPLSRRISRLEAQGYDLSRPGPGGSKLISVAAFDRATNEATDVVRATNGGAAQPATTPAPAKAGEDLVYAREQARNAAYSADLKRLELDERLGRLLSIEDVVDAMTRCAGAIVRGLDALPSSADDIAAAVARDGSYGARRLLKQRALDLRETLSREMRLLADRAARETPPDAGADDADGQS